MSRYIYLNKVIKSYLKESNYVPNYAIKIDLFNLFIQIRTYMFVFHSHCSKCVLQHTNKLSRVYFQFQTLSLVVHVNCSLCKTGNLIFKFLKHMLTSTINCLFCIAPKVKVQWAEFWGKSNQRFFEISQSPKTSSRTLIDYLTVRAVALSC